MNNHHQSTDLGRIITIVILFLFPPTSQVMIALVLIATPATLIVYATGLLLGRLPMLVAAALAFILTVATMIQLIINQLR